MIETVEYKCPKCVATISKNHYEIALVGFMCPVCRKEEIVNFTPVIKYKEIV